jgi:hypothetical protein
MKDEIRISTRVPFQLSVFILHPCFAGLDIRWSPEVEDENEDEFWKGDRHGHQTVPKRDFHVLREGTDRSQNEKPSL